MGKTLKYDSSWGNISLHFRTVELESFYFYNKMAGKAQNRHSHHEKEKLGEIKGSPVPSKFENKQ